MNRTILLLAYYDIVSLSSNLLKSSSKYLKYFKIRVMNTLVYMRLVLTFNQIRKKPSFISLISLSIRILWSYAWTIGHSLVVRWQRLCFKYRVRSDPKLLPNLHSTYPLWFSHVICWINQHNVLTATTVNVNMSFISKVCDISMSICDISVTITAWCTYCISRVTWYMLNSFIKIIYHLSLVSTMKGHTHIIFKRGHTAIWVVLHALHRTAWWSCFEDFWMGAAHPLWARW